MSYFCHKENYDYEDDLYIITDFKYEDFEITNELVREAKNSEISEATMNFFLLYKLLCLIFF